MTSTTEHHIDLIEAAMDRLHRVRHRRDKPVRVMRKTKTLRSHRR